MLKTIQLNRRIIITTWESSVDQGGGVINTEVDSWVLWAKATDRSGNGTTVNGQRIYPYDIEFTVRYFVSKPITSQNTVTYLDKSYKIQSVLNDVEGDINYQIIKCTVANG